MTDYTDYSGFLSKFNFGISGSGSGSYTDILSNTTVPITSPMWSSNATGSSYTGRYFVIADLLIQFSVYTTIMPQSDGSGSIVNINFPYSYDVNPYCVLLQPLNPYGNTYTSCVLDMSPGSFNCSTANNSNAFIQYIAIGPRPSDL